MFRMITCSVAILIGATGCRNREPPARIPEPPPAPSSSVAPAAAAGPAEDLAGKPFRKTESRARVGRTDPKALPQ
jgi:hypothetical protein